jgi:hypothetical protein
MAAVSGQRSDFRAARKNYEEALSPCPDFIPAKRRLAILSAANPGDNQQADDLATKALGIILSIDRAISRVPRVC